MSDLNDILVFKAVVEHQSFTATAEALGMLKSGVSRKVSRLEQDLGARLLERSTRALHLTEVGQAVYQHAQRISEELESAKHCVDSLATKPKGWIKLSTSISLGQSMFAKPLQQFSQAYPDIHLDIDLTNRRVDIIEEGFDLLIRAGESPDSNLLAKKLVDTHWSLFASKDYLARCQEIPNSPEQLAQQLEHHNCLYMKMHQDKPSWQLVNGNEEQHSIAISPSFICNDIATVEGQARAGLGIAMLPEQVFTIENQRYAERQQLVKVLPNWQGKLVNIYGIYPSRKGATPKIRALLDFLADYFAS